MAAGNVQSFVNDVENMCECYICCVEYDENKHVPRVLPCQHTFCTECLSKHCKGEKLKCPLCNQEHFTKNGNVKVFHKDNTRRDLKELLERFTKTLCGVCKRHDHTRYICITCNIRMCRSCYKEKKSNDCRKHDFEIPEDSSLSPDTSLELKDKQTQQICLLSGHEHNELKYYCAEKQCCKPVCAYCIVEVHKEHAFNPIENEYENRKKSMQSICQATSMKIYRAKKLLENVEKETASLTDSHKKGRENLTAEANRGIRYIQAKKENAQKKSDDTLQMYCEILKEKKEKLQYFIDNASECCAISEEALKENNTVTFLSVEKTLTDKLNCFMQSTLDRPLDMMPRESFEMKHPIMELNERINKMIRDEEEVDKQQKLVPGFIGLRLDDGIWLKYATYIFCLLEVACSIAFLWWFLSLPYTSVWKTDHSYLEFSNNQSSWTCYSLEERIVSNIPMENVKQSCGNSNSPYIFKGVFTNSTILHGKEESFLFQTDVFHIAKYSPGLILFEFGISAGKVEGRNIFSHSSVDVFGWFLQVVDGERAVVLKNIYGKIIYRSFLSILEKTSFEFSIAIDINGIVKLKFRNKSLKTFDSLEETDMIETDFKFVFVKTCDEVKAGVSIQILTANLSFNESTLYPNLYISPDNKTIANTKRHSFSRKQIVNNRLYQDILLRNCTTDCIYVLDFRVNFPKNYYVFSLGITNLKYLQMPYHKQILFSYIQCSFSRFFTYSTFCLLVDESIQYAFTSLSKMSPNEWHRLIIIAHKKHNSALFIFESFQVEIQFKDSIFQSGIPILRLTMENIEDSVEIKLGNRNDFDIWTLLITKFWHCIGIFVWFFVSILPISPWCIFTILLIWFTYQFILTFLDELSKQKRMLDENEHRVVERRQRGRRRRNH